MLGVYRRDPGGSTATGFADVRVFPGPPPDDAAPLATWPSSWEHGTLAAVGEVRGPSAATDLKKTLPSHKLRGNVCVSVCTKSLGFPVAGLWNPDCAAPGAKV